MQVTSDALKQLQLLSEQGGRYRTHAYLFVLTGLDYTLRRLYRHKAREAVERHVTGQELCWGLRDLALLEWGRLARVVLAHMSIRRTHDFGKIVYSMIENHLMQRRNEDSVEDFKDVFEFVEALDRGYRIEIPEPKKE